MGILQETKLTNSIHMRYRLGYSLWEMEGESCHCGGGCGGVAGGGGLTGQWDG